MNHRKFIHCITFHISLHFIHKFSIGFIIAQCSLEAYFYVWDLFSSHCDALEKFHHFLVSRFALFCFIQN